MLYNKRVDCLVKLVVKFEFKRFFFKSILLNSALPEGYRVKAFRLLSAFNKRTSLSYLQLRCVLSNRSKSLLPMFKLSRIAFRNMYSYGYLNGLRKSSR